MRKTEVEEILTEKCQRNYTELYGQYLRFAVKFSAGITNNVICAGGIGDGKDTCQGKYLRAGNFF